MYVSCSFRMVSVSTLKLICKATFNVDVQKGIIDIVPTADSAGAGAFEIDTGSFIAADNVLIGMSKPDPGNPGFFAPTAMVSISYMSPTIPYLHKDRLMLPAT